MVEGLLRLADENVDAHELVLEVGAKVRIPGRGQERDGALPLADRFVLLPEIRQREPVEGMELGVSGAERS